MKKLMTGVRRTGACLLFELFDWNFVTAMSNTLEIKPEVQKKSEWSDSSHKTTHSEGGHGNSQTCVICFENIAPSNGIFCCGPQSHFVCCEDLENYIANECESSIEHIRARQGKIRCPAQIESGMCTGTYSDYSIGSLSENIFNTYWDMKKKLLDQEHFEKYSLKLNAEVERQPRTFWRRKTPPLPWPACWATATHSAWPAPMHAVWIWPTRSLRLLWLGCSSWRADTAWH